MGPYGFNWVAPTPTFDFISEIGLILLMFIAGLEIKLASFKSFHRDLAWLSFINAAIPFAVGFSIGMLFDFSTTAALLLGIIFMSSSIAVIVPSLEAAGIIHHKIGKEIVSAIIIIDIASLVLLSVLIQSIAPVTELPLLSFYFILTLILIGFRYALPKLRDLIPRRRDEHDLFESEVRIVMAMLIGVVVTFELLGLHPIIAGFFTGLVLSESISSKILIDKLHTISYGVFIPVFFISIGMHTNILVFLESIAVLGLITAVVAGSMGSKFISGWIGARAAGFSSSDAATMGIASLPQLSTSLAVVFTGVELELIPPELVTAMVILSVISTLASPLLLRAKYPTTT